MKKFILGLLCGIALMAGSAAYASDALQPITAYLFPVKFVINGQSKELGGEYTAFNYNGHAYVPVRFVAESMGGVVGYDEGSETIHILYPDLAYIKANMDIGKTESDVIRLLGGNYKKVVYPNMKDEQVWRYDLGVRDGYQVQSVLQHIETWADPEGLKNGRIQTQLLIIWREGKVDEYYWAYAGESGEVRYGTSEAQLKRAHDKLLAGYADIENKFKVKLMYGGVADSKLEFVFRGREDFQRRRSDRELTALRRSVYEAAGLNILRPFPFKFEQFVWTNRANISGVITEVDTEGERILIVDHMTMVTEEGISRPEAVWVKLHEDGKIVGTSGKEPIAFRDLHIGQKAAAWFDGGIVLTSSPAQTGALLIRVEQKE